MKILTDTGLVAFWNKIKQLVLGNRPYEPTEFSGKGYKVLEKNIQTVGGVKKNILTAAMLSEANTIYEIRYDFDLNGETIEMQEGCTLKFKGGSLSNGCIDGHVEIKASKYKIFDNIIFSKINYLSTCFVEWFGADGGSHYADYDKIGDSTKAINESLKYFVNVKLSNSIYKVTDTIHVSATSFFCGNSTTLAFAPCNPKDNKYMVIYGESEEVYTVSEGRITDH